MRPVLGLAACALAFGAAAEEDARWYVQVDNDVVFVTDRWYTSGVRLARVQRAPGRAIEWGLLQEVYTPESRRFEPGQVDRGPTARLQLAAARHDALPGGLQTLELRVGVRGQGAQGERSTAFIHHLVPAPDVDWSRESSTRGDVQAAAARSHALGPVRVHYGAVLGNQLAFAHAGVEVRTGAGNLLDAYSPMLRHAATPPFALDAGQPDGWNAFAGASLRGVARNELLDRGYDAFAGAPDRRRGIARFAMGVAAANRWGSLVFALVQDMREFATQREPHRFGSLTLHVPF